MNIVALPRPVTFVLGIDPGPPSGGAAVTLLRQDGPPQSYQCNSDAAGWLLHCLLGTDGIAARLACVRGGIEGFAGGNGPGARQHGSAVSEHAEELAGICAGYGVPLASRYMGLVRPWATDKRLREAGLYGLTAGGPHMRASARHALYCSVHDCGWPDPLSRRTS